MLASELSKNQLQYRILCLSLQQLPKLNRMKLRFFIQILIISSLLYEISSTVPAGMTFVKNFTGQTPTSVYKLGKFSVQGYITVKNLVNQDTTVMLFTTVYQGGNFVRQDYSVNSIEPLKTVNLTIGASTLDQYLSVYLNLGKISVEVKNANGGILNPIDQTTYGGLNTPEVRVVFNNDCNVYFDRNQITGPFYDSTQRVLLYFYPNIVGTPAIYKFVELTSSNPTISSDIPKGTTVIYQMSLLSPVDPITYSFGIPVYSPTDKKCQIQRVYRCDNMKYDYCRIYEGGQKCGGSDNMTCIKACGDNIVDKGEQCDGGIWCSSDCKIILCGNGILDAGEECDNKKKAGCLNCKVQSPYKCKNPAGKPSLCFICGNSIFQQGEECDNGNKTGCVNCTLDRGFTCKRKINEISNCTNICGDGLLVAGEECDNRNQTGCINCAITAGYTCRGPPYTTSKCLSCGNNIVEWPQQCDNNNANGCKACKIQPGWNCRANPKYCYRITQVCGNGEREIQQDCDDGNKVNGDGCSSLCKKESGYTCSVALGEKTTCSLATQL